MDIETRSKIELLLSHPDDLLKKPPFFRELSYKRSDNSKIRTSGTTKVTLPCVNKTPVTQADFACELDVFSHKVLFDENIPSITVKVQKDDYLDIEQHRMAVPFQVLIRDKQVRHLCVNNMSHTLLNTHPTQHQMENFIRIKQGWAEKNMEGAKTKFVQDQKSYGDAALLFMQLNDGTLCTKNINFADGYIIISHKDDVGRHILECLYYAVTDKDGNETEYLDCYDDEYITRLTKNNTVIDGVNNEGWIRHPAVRHGFSENPLITKRGEVAWNRGQKTIESYEALYNTFIVIQKRYGWGALYVKGRFNNSGKKIAGAVVLNDTSLDANADAKFLTPPTPSNMIETLELMEQTIQKSTGTTFILPKDIRISGDASGLAIEMTQELDMATAQDGVIEWQNVANKMMRLFKEGLAKELVLKKEDGFESAMTEFDELRIHTAFCVWKPKSEEAHNQMLIQLYGAGGISKQTFVEKNTISTPDETARIKREYEETLATQQMATEANATTEDTTTSDNNTVTDE